MADIVDKATRSRMMAGIRGKNTRPEIAVRKYLHAAGLRFRLHASDLPARPDIVLRSRRTVVFVHGCYWHRHANCRFAYIPKTRKGFWTKKFASNVARDRLSETVLANTGWRVLTIWECESSNARALDRLVRQVCVKPKKKTSPT